LGGEFTPIFKAGIGVKPSPDFEHAKYVFCATFVYIQENYKNGSVYNFSTIFHGLVN